MKVEIKPEFLKSALDQEKPVRKGIAKMLEVAEALDMAGLLAHQGVHLEKINGWTLPDGTQLYTLRATKAARAVASIKGNTLVLHYVEPDHDKVYP